MKKIVLLLFTFLLIGINTLRADISIEVYPPTLDFEVIPEYCASLTDTIFVTMDTAWARAEGVKSHQWRIAGDLQFAPGNNSRTFPTVKIISTPNGYGKGRITYSYRGTGCSSAYSFDIYKQFEIPDSIEIEGPECIVKGQVVVYSVDPIITRNLDAQIGMDYYWNVLQNPKPAFVDSILYVSGDGSSVTFLVDSVPANAVIEAGIGRCNTQILTKDLGNATPAPEFYTDTLFVPYGIEPFIVTLKNPKPGVSYAWAIDDEHAASFHLNRFIGDSVTITIDESAKSDVCTITAMATYTAITCNTTSKSIAIKRAWGNNINIIPKNLNETLKRDTCYSVNTHYKFSLSGDIPGSSYCEWQLPHGWKFKDDIVNNSQTIEVYPTASALIDDVIQVRPLDRRDTASTRSYPVHVVPARITSIIAPGCVAIGEPQTFSIDTTGITPYAASFYWEVDSAVAIDGNGTTSISFIPTYGTTHVSVTALGINGCDADVYTQSLNLPPIAPVGIESDNECLFTNMHDTFTLSIIDPVPDQQYGWNVPTGWLVNYPDETYHTSIRLASDGLRGNHLVEAWAIGSGICSQSQSATYTIQVDTMEWSIVYQYSFFSRKYEFTLFYQDFYPDEFVNAHWYVDGESTSSAYDYSISLSQLPQTIVAVLDDCNMRVVWTNPQSSPALRGNPKASALGDSNNSLTIAPIPANNAFTINLPENRKYTLSIMSQEGKNIVVKTIEGGQASVDTSHIPNGVYLVIVRGGHYQANRQIIIQH